MVECFCEIIPQSKAAPHPPSSSSASSSPSPAAPVGTSHGPCANACSPLRTAMHSKEPSPGAGGRNSRNSMWGFLDVRNEETVRRSVSRGSISSFTGPSPEQAHSALMTSRRSSSEGGAVVFSSFDTDTDAARRTSGSRTFHMCIAV